MRTLLVLGLAAVCAINANPIEDKRRIFPQSVMEFSNNFYKAVGQENTGNLITSPISAHAALTMTGFGAEGNTSVQMRRALRLPEDDQLTKDGFGQFFQSLAELQNVKLDVANKIFVSDSVMLKDNYTELTKTVFHSEITKQDFSNIDETVKAANEWVSQNTGGKITEMLSGDDVDPDTRMILLNAIYLKSEWLWKFNKDMTHQMPFYVSADVEKYVPTMFMATQLGAGELPELKARFVVLPYNTDEKHEMNMIVVVPNEIDGLQTIEENLDKIPIDDIREGYAWSDVELYLPRFKVSSDINLKSPLSKMGMSEMFTDKANFLAMTDTPLKVGHVIQKAFIEVNEEGSEAAAATSVGMVFKMAGPEPAPLMIRADKPFYYFIMIDDTVLFQGRVVDPTV